MLEITFRRQSQESDTNYQAKEEDQREIRADISDSGGVAFRKMAFMILIDLRELMMGNLI